MRTIDTRPGVTIANGNASIWLWAPKAKQAAVQFGHDNEILFLDELEYGYWYAETDKIKDGTPYRFVLDDEEPLPDPASLYQPDGVHGASQAVDLTYDWTDSQWATPPLAEYIIYELHTGTFGTGGNFKGIEAKLDHLVELGVTAIEIMPVAQFPGERNWGYDGVFPYAVQNSYGGIKGLQKLVDACHAKGLSVILDVVYNHLGPEGNYFGSYGPYFTDKYQTPWGNAINFDDAGCDAVRHYFIQNTLMWFRDVRVDALRMDAVHAIKDLGTKHFLAKLKEKVDELNEQTGRKHHLIVECDLNDPRFINSLADHGFGMDAQWIDEFHHALRVSAGGDRTGYYSDFNGIADLTKAYNDAYVYDGQYSPHRDKHFGGKATNNTGDQFIVFSQNHDQVGNRMLGERSSELFDLETQKLMAGAVLASPYVPMLFMGEEYAEPNRFMYFVSHTDPELAEAVRKGRKAEFEAFHADGEAPDPMAVETFNDSKLRWDLTGKGDHAVMLNFYKALIALRKKHPILQKLDRKVTKATCNEEQQLLFLQRGDDKAAVHVVMNFSDQMQQLPAPLAGETLFDSADQKWGGPGASKGSTIQPRSFIIYNS